jgi:hypothetical protein
MRLLRGQIPEFIAIIGGKVEDASGLLGAVVLPRASWPSPVIKRFPLGQASGNNPLSYSNSLRIHPSPSRSLVRLARLVHGIVR